VITLHDKVGREFRVDPDAVTDVRAYVDTSHPLPVSRLILNNRAIFLAEISAPALLDRINALRTAPPLILGPFLIAPSRPPLPLRTLTPRKDLL
jgi:hypothetical protein